MGYYLAILHYNNLTMFSYFLYIAVRGQHVDVAEPPAQPPAQPPFNREAMLFRFVEGLQAQIRAGAANLGTYLLFDIKIEDKFFAMYLKSYVIMVIWLKKGNEQQFLKDVLVLHCCHHF